MDAPLSTPFTAAEREQLILDHLPQVRLIAKRIYNQTQRRGDLDDLVSAGIIGLIAAVDRFEPALGFKLKTYAEFKIRGEILDMLRHLDTLGRKTRAQCKRIEAVTHTLQQHLGRTPAVEEIAEAVGISVAEYQANTLAYRNSITLSLDVLPVSQSHTSLNEVFAAACCTDPHAPLPDQHAATAELANAMRAALQDLSPEDENLLTLHYGQGMSILALADLLDTPEWTIRTQRDRALTSLRTSLAAFRSFPLIQPLQLSVF